jgi:hypothetical protein
MGPSWLMQQSEWSISQLRQPASEIGAVAEVAPNDSAALIARNAHWFWFTRRDRSHTFINIGFVRTAILLTW